MIPHSRPWVTEADCNAVNECLRSGMIARGAHVEEFEHQMALHLGARGCVAVSSGTAALSLSLQGLSIGTGDEVVIPSYVCRNVAEAVLSVGAKPIFSDIGPAWCMTPETVKNTITSKTKAVILVKTFGIQLDTKAFEEFEIPIVEDSCQSLGPANCTLERAKASVFSFHATKCLTTGEGGMIASNDDDLLLRMRKIRDGSDHGLMRRFPAPLTDLQAALGISQLNRYQIFLQKRLEIAALYFEALKDLPIQLPVNLKNRSIFFRFPVRIKEEFDGIQEAFQQLGVRVCRGIDQLLHLQFGENKSKFQSTEQTFKETLSLPIYPSLKSEEIDTVIKAAHKVWG